MELKELPTELTPAAGIAAVCVGGGRLAELTATEVADGGDGACCLCRQMKTDRSD